MYAALSYTLSKATNTTEPDGNGIGAEREQHRAARRRRARTERGRSASSRGHHVQLPAAVQHHGRHGDAARVGASVQRHDRRRQQRRRRATTTGPSSTARSSASRRSAARRRRTCRSSSRAASSWHGRTILLRLEGFNLFNHGNYLGRGQTTYGDTATTVNDTFGQLVERRHGDERDPGVREHRSAADVPAAGAVPVLKTLVSEGAGPRASPRFFRGAPFGFRIQPGVHCARPSCLPSGSGACANVTTTSTPRSGRAGAEWELQIIRNGKRLLSWRFPDRDAASAEAASRLKELERSGWHTHW